MRAERFTPPVNEKRTMTKDDWPGWYQITLVGDKSLVVVCHWWNGNEWNHGPNRRLGFGTERLGGAIRGIVRLCEA